MEPVVDERTRTVLLRARVTNQGFKLKPGMFVRVGLTLDTRQNAILVSEPAIWPQGQDSFVFRVVDGTAVLTKVKLGQRRPGEVEVLAGLSPGDMVITDGQIKMKDGAPVTVLPVGTAAHRERRAGGRPGSRTGVGPAGQARAIPGRRQEGLTGFFRPSSRWRGGDSWFYLTSRSSVRFSPP